jgi:hypothetical protein
MAKSDGGMVEIELTPETQTVIVALASHALGAALARLQALRDEGVVVSPAQLRRVVAALRPREFCQAALVLGSDATISNEQLIEAARLSGEKAVTAAGPFARVVN